MRRREVITLLGVAVASPLAARADNPGRMRRIGVLLGNNEGDPQPVAGMSAFRQAMKELGWSEGRNLQIDLQWGRADPARMQILARQLVEQLPDILLASTTPAVAALHAATNSVPTLFVMVSDPIGSGFVASLPQPGGNITGFINIESSLGGKWVEILKELGPGVSHAAILFNPETAPYYAYYVKPFEAAAHSLQIEPLTSPVRSLDEIEQVIKTLADKPHPGMVMAPDSFMNARSQSDFFISLAAEHGIPAVYPYANFVRAGGLVSYGIDQVDLYRRVPTYVDRIFKGAKPSDLPVQLPTKFEMAVNLKTAKALSLAIPAALVASADEVID